MLFSVVTHSTSQRESRQIKKRNLVYEITILTSKTRVHSHTKQIIEFMLYKITHLVL